MITSNTVLSRLNSWISSKQIVTKGVESKNINNNERPTKHFLIICILYILHTHMLIIEHMKKYVQKLVYLYNPCMKYINIGFV